MENIFLTHLFDADLAQTNSNMARIREKITIEELTDHCDECNQYYGKHTAHCVAYD